MSKTLPTLNSFVEDRFIDQLNTLKQDRESHIVLRGIFRFAQFLQQNLALWMFIACDKEGKPMEEPKDLEEFRHDTGLEFDEWNKAVIEFQEALDRCLFTGIEIESRGGYSTIQKKSDGIPFGECYSDSTDWYWYEHDTIESLIKIGIEPTERVIKELELT